MVEILDPVTNKTWSYHVDKRIQKFLDKKVKDSISKNDKDFVMIVDGYEGSGKSTFAQQIGKYVDHSLNISRICMTADEFKQAITNAGKAQCVIYDEAVTGMTAGDSITRIGRLLKSMMMQMRQKNLFVIVIIPTIFELNKYTVLARSRCLFHIYENKGKMGYWVGYNKKHMRDVYLKGKKTYSYKVWSRFRGRFYGKYVVDYEEYRKKKLDALSVLDMEEVDVKENKFISQRDSMLNILHKELGMGAPKLSKILESYSVVLSKTAIGQIMTKYSQIIGKTPENSLVPAP